MKPCATACPRVQTTRVQAHAANLDAIADQFDVFLLDAFGVLNIGETAIPGVVERVAGLKARGKQIIVVTNAAGYPSSVLHARYRRLGYDFRPDDAVSSRMALLAGLEKRHPSRKWGVMASAAIRPRGNPGRCRFSRG
jgi:glycerol 3-phosphatase-2